MGDRRPIMVHGSGLDSSQGVHRGMQYDDIEAHIGRDGDAATVSIHGYDGFTCMSHEELRRWCTAVLLALDTWASAADEPGEADG